MDEWNGTPEREEWVRSVADVMSAGMIGRSLRDHVDPEICGTGSRAGNIGGVMRGWAADQAAMIA
jgi:hypothetical protein